MGTAVRILPHYTYAEYQLWEGNWELIEGIPHAMSPAPLPKHQKICMSLGAILFNAVKDSGCKKCTVSTPVDYLIAEDTIVQPDVLIYCNEKKTLSRRYSGISGRSEFALHSVKRQAYKIWFV